MVQLSDYTSILEDIGVSIFVMGVFVGAVIVYSIPSNGKT